jgi:hypothetical protein
MPAMAPTEPAPAFNKKSSMPLRMCIYRQRGNFWLEGHAAGVACLMRRTRTRGAESEGEKRFHCAI